MRLNAYNPVTIDMLCTLYTQSCIRCGVFPRFTDFFHWGKCKMEGEDGGTPLIIDATHFYLFWGACLCYMLCFILWCFASYTYLLGRGLIFKCVVTNQARRVHPVGKRSLIQPSVSLLSPALSRSGAAFMCGFYWGSAAPNSCLAALWWYIVYHERHLLTGLKNYFYELYPWVEFTAVCHLQAVFNEMSALNCILFLLQHFCVHISTWSWWQQIIDRYFYIHSVMREVCVCVCLKH